MNNIFIGLMLLLIMLPVSGPASAWGHANHWGGSTSHTRGSGSTDSTGSKTPGAGVGLLSLLATHNPLGLIVSSGMRVHGEKTGSDTIQGRAKQTAREIADVLKKRFQEEGWI